MPSRGRVLISGAGIAGPTLAWWLQRQGFQPTVVERSPAPRNGGYMIDFWGVGYDVAERMGLLPALRERAYFIDEVRLVDAQGHRVGGFGAHGLRAALGERFFSIPRGDLAEVLYGHVQHDAEFVFGDEVTALVPRAQSVDVAFAKGSPSSFDLVVGADGLHSVVRRLAFGPQENFEHRLPYAVAAFETADYPQRDENAYVSFTQPGRQVARYALRNGRSAFFFVFEAPPAEAMPGPHDVAAQKRMLRQRYGDAGWECKAILDALESCDDLYFDRVSQIRMPAWSSGRVALVGDAAYAPSLLAGQGAAFAMCGAYVLAGELQRSSATPAAAFERYHSRLQAFISRKQVAARHLGGWFAPHTRLGLVVRNQASRLMSAGPLAKWLIGRELADRIDLPDYG